jgi:hypothetical protein
LFFGREGRGGLLDRLFEELGHHAMNITRTRAVVQLAQAVRDGAPAPSAGVLAFHAAVGHEAVRDPVARLLVVHLISPRGGLR